MAPYELDAGNGPQVLDSDPVKSSDWRPSTDKHPEEATRFLEPEDNEDPEATADHHITSEISQLDGREPFDPILWSSKKKWMHILVVSVITCIT